MTPLILLFVAICVSCHAGAEGSPALLLPRARSSDTYDHHRNLLGTCPQSIKLGVNVLANPSAENGATCDGSSEEMGTTENIRTIPCWSGRAAAVCYGASDSSGDFPTDGPTPASGITFFAGGRTDSTQLTQTVQLPSEWAAAVATDKLQFTFKAWLGGWEGQDDYVLASVTFWSAGNDYLGIVSLPKVTAATRNSQTGFQLLSKKGIVPRGTAVMRVELKFVLVNGSYNDAYADDISLSFVKIL